VRSDAVSTFYMMNCRAGANPTALLKVIVGSFSIIGSTVAQTWAAADVAYLEVIGSTLIGKRNGNAFISVSGETSITTGKPGIETFGTTIRYDSWVAGEIVMLLRYVDTGSTAGGDGTTEALTGATRAFASLQAAVASMPGTLTDPVTIQCAATGGAADTLSVIQTQWDFVTSPTNYILVTVKASDRHTGKWDTAKYRIEVTNADGIYNNNCSHVRLEWLQVQITVSTSGGSGYNCYRLATSNNSSANIDHRYHNCIANVVVSGGATDNVFGFIDSDPTPQTGTCKRMNCIAVGGYAGFSSDSGAWATANLYNYNCTAAANEFNYMDAQICVNCLSAAPTGGAGGFLSVGSSGHFNNASDDNTAAGTNSRINQTFTFVNTGARDYHLTSADAGARNFGLSDPSSGLYSDDIDGQTRTGSWDIGADEVVTLAVLTGTAMASIVEGDIVTGGKTIIVTLTGDTYVPTSAIGASPTLRGVGAFGSGTTSFTAAVPTAGNAPQAGDAMYIIMESTDSSTTAGTPNTPGGWNKLFENTIAAGSSTEPAVSTLTIFGKIAGAGEGNVTVDGVGNHCAGAMIVVAGHGLAAITSTVVGAATDHGTSTTNVLAPSINVTAGSFIITCMGLGDDAADTTNVSGVTNANLAGIAERIDQTVSTGSGGGVGIYTATCAGSSTGTTEWDHDTAASSQSMQLGITPVVTTPFANARAAFIAGFDSAQSEGTGWDAEVKAKAAVTEVARTSDTVATWTIGAQAGYNITAQETVTGTIPASILSGGAAVVATPTFTVDPAVGGGIAVPVITRQFRERWG